MSILIAKKELLTAKEPLPNDTPFEMGRMLEVKQPFDLMMKWLFVHMAVLGGSGTGKSNFLKLLFSYLIRLGEGFFFADPHGDTADWLMGYVYRKLRDGMESVFERAHFLEIGPHRAFALDPAAHLPGWGAGKLAYYSLLKATVDSVVTCMLRRVAEADQQVMLRLKRWLKNVVYACLVDYTGNNTHVGLHKALVFTNPDHPEFTGLMDKVFPFLPDYVQEDFKALMRTQKAQDREKWVESTVNRLRDILSPLLILVFSQQKPSINILKIIRDREFVLVSIPRSSFVSQDEKVTLIGLLVDQVLSAKQAEERQLPESLRERFTLGIDECGEVLGEDLKLTLGAARKFRMPVVLAAQNLKKFALGDFQMASEVLAECQVKVIFQQQEDEDLQAIVKSIGYGNLDLTERYVEVQRTRRLKEIKQKKHSYGQSFGINHNEGQSASETNTKGKTLNQQVSTASTETNMVGHAVGGTKGESVRDDEKTRSVNQSQTDTTSASSGQTQSTTTGTTDINSTGKTTGTSSSDGVQLGWSHTVAEETTYVPDIETSLEPSGQLDKGSIEVQWTRLFQAVHGYGVGEALVKLPHLKAAFPVKFAWAKPCWEGCFDEVAPEMCKQKLFALRAYNFVPSDDATPDVVVDVEPTEPNPMA